MSVDTGGLSSLLQDCLLCGSIESQHRITKENQEKWTEDFCKLYDVDITCTGTDEAELHEIQHTLQTANYCLDCLSELRSISAFYKTIDDVNAQLKVIQLQCESKLKSCLEALKQPLASPHLKHSDDQKPEQEDGDEHQQNYAHMYERKQRLLKCMQKRHLAANHDEDDDDVGAGSASADGWRRRRNKAGAQWESDLNSDTGEALTPDFHLQPESTYSDGDDEQDYDNFNSTFVDKDPESHISLPRLHRPRARIGYSHKLQRRKNAPTRSTGAAAEGEAPESGVDAEAVVRPQLPFPCTRDGCHESFHLAVDLEEHIKRIHEGLKYPFPCDTCRKPCYSYWKLQDHQNIHKGLTPYECPDPSCLKKFATRFMLTCHVRRKKIQKRRPAPPPPPDPHELLAQLDLAPTNRLKNKNQRKASQRIQTMLQRKQRRRQDEAENAKAEAKRKAEALPPRRRMPRKDLDLPFQFRCTYPECTKQFRKETQREGHIKVDHEKSIKFPFPCDLCHKACYSYEKLLQHGNIHKGLTPFPCPDPGCDKSFATEQLLYFHRRRKNLAPRSSSRAKSKQEAEVEEEDDADDWDDDADPEQDDDDDEEPAKPKRRKSRKVTSKRASSRKSKTSSLKRKRKSRTADLPFQFQCTYPDCTKQFRKEAQREGHIKTYHEKSIKFPFPCDVCAKPCYTYENLVQHANVHEGVTPYECPDPDCGKKFATEQLLYYHRRSKKLRKPHAPHSEEADDDAEEKGASAADDDVDEFGVRKKTKRLPYKFRCAEASCTKQFRTEGALADHVKQVHELQLKYPFNCLQCNKPCYTFKKWQQHGNIHEGLTPFACPAPDCPKKFSTEVQLQTHRRRTHDQHCTLCDYCGKAFKSNNSYRMHVKLHERGEDGDSGEVAAKTAGSFKCETCGKSYGSVNTYKAHLLTHDSSKIDSLSCKDCCKVFSSKHYLKIHEQVAHTKNYSFRCHVDDCTFGAADKHSFERHLAIAHTDDRPFICDICQHSFQTRYYLNSHKKRVHPASKDFVCAVCGKGFSNKRYLQEHEETHKEVKSFLCPECGRGFTQRTRLTMHLRNAHGGGQDGDRSGRGRKHGQNRARVKNQQVVSVIEVTATKSTPEASAAAALSAPVPVAVSVSLPLPLPTSSNNSAAAAALLSFQDYHQFF